MATLSGPTYECRAPIFLPGRPARVCGRISIARNPPPRPDRDGLCQFLHPLSPHAKMARAELRQRLPAAHRNLQRRRRTREKAHKLLGPRAPAVKSASIALAPNYGRPMTAAVDGFFSAAQSPVPQVTRVSDELEL